MISTRGVCITRVLTSSATPPRLLLFVAGESASRQALPAKADIRLRMADRVGHRTVAAKVFDLTVHVSVKSLWGTYTIACLIFDVCYAVFYPPAHARIPPLVGLPLAAGLLAIKSLDLFWTYLKLGYLAREVSEARQNGAKKQQ